MTTRLFVGNLPDSVNENDLQSAFCRFGEINNIDIKCKPDVENEKKRFAFVTLSSTENDIELCLKHFSHENFHGNLLYVTKARESFLERLQREREQAQNKNSKVPTQNTHIDVQRNDFFKENRTNKRKFLNIEDTIEEVELPSKKHIKSKYENNYQNDDISETKAQSQDKKHQSEQKRLESMKRKRQEFKQKKLIIKTGLTGIDKITNTKIKFSDNEDGSISTSNKNVNGTVNKKADLFDDDGSDDGINFDIKERYEGKKGQKVLDLQSKYKSDKRFVLDERFVEDSDDENEGISNNIDGQNDDEAVELEQADEKSKQVKILQDLLGVAIRPKQQDTSIKTKAKLGMLRFDPLQPEHAKFLAPVTAKPETTKKSKKKHSKDKDEVIEQPPVVEVPKVVVSKEQFYEVSNVLKEAIAQPTSFSLRNLFSKNVPTEEETQNETAKSIPLDKTKNKKLKNPMDPGEKNPFVYDSSESEDEETVNVKKPVETEKSEVKAVWRENLFLSFNDNRLREGLEFFNKSIEGDIQKERRQLKSVMKKRLYNKERKNKMFQKKIGGRKKNMKKSYNKRS